jgi:hypothetical protein
MSRAVPDVTPLEAADKGLANLRAHRERLDRIQRYLKGEHETGAESLRRHPEQPARKRHSAYLDGMLHMIGGNTRWHFLTPRYNGPDHVWNGITSGLVTWFPDHTVYGSEPDQ